MSRLLLTSFLLLVGSLGPWLTAHAQGTKTQTAHPERPNYRGIGKDWEKTTPPDSSKLTYTVFLIGDVGKPALPEAGGEPSLNFLRRQIMKEGERSTTIYLGDNIYEYGLPPTGALDRKVSEQRLIEQINVLRNYKGEKYMIPGNHDWKQGQKGSLDQVIRAQNFIEDYMNKDSAAFTRTGAFYVPANGCPGPYEILVQDNLAIIAINSQWFLQTSERPYGANSGCGVANEADFFTQLEDLMAKHRNKNVVVIAHHPIFSDGIHGGYFTLADHLFPLSIVYKYAFIPFPIIGSVYPFARKYGGISQDIPHPLYQQYKKGLMDIFAKYPNTIYAAGHEHNLQYFKVGDLHQIVSGSGCKTQHVRTGRDGDALFSDKEKGWARVNYYNNGEVWLEYWIPNDRGESGRIVYRQALYAKQAVAGDAPTGPDPFNVDIKGRPNYKDSTVTVAVNPRYAQRSGFHQALFGKHYRAEWATPVKFPVLDLATEKGGLEPYKIGGGKQTASLKVRNEEGRNYTIRGLDKDPSAVLPEALRESAAKDILQDQISAQHPYGSVVLPPLASRAGILHTNPELRYIPRDPLLGQYLARFQDTPAALEEDAKDDQSNVASLNFATNLVGTDRVLERMRQDNDNHIKGKAFVRSRLFDMWIGDWDRHEDQWRWAESKNEDGDRTFTAVPEDRDIAFFKGDGFFPWLARRKWAVRNFQNFGEDYADWKGLNLTALSNDRVFLGEMSRKDWVETAEDMKRRLTDAAIDSALRTRWPEQIYKLHGAEIAAKLKSRRDLLPQLANDYFELLSEKVEVKGSEKQERFVVERLPDNKTRVLVKKVNKEGKTTKTLWDQTYNGDITKEIRLYGFAGNDSYRVRGSEPTSIRLRIIGGINRDTIVDESTKGGSFLRPHSVQVYDADSGNVIVPGKETRLRLAPGSEVSEYDYPSRTNKRDYKLPYFGPAVFFGYNVDDGVFIGGGGTLRTYGFRREPFATEQTLVANYAPSRQAYNVRYTGVFTDVLGKYDLRIDSRLYGPQLLYNYFGAGNDTRNVAQADGTGNPLGNRAINDTYRIRFSRFNFSPTLETDVFSFLKFGIGPQYDQWRIDRAQIGREIQAGIDNGFTGAATGIRESDFGMNRYLGGRAYLNLDASSSPINPRIGLRWYNSAEYNSQLNGEKLKYGRLSSEVRFYVSPNFPFQLTWAGRIGAARNIGDYRFYQANTLGGTTNLRGYRRTRYAGRSMTYANAEVRVQLFTFNAYLVPGKFGIMGLADAGRVYSSYDIEKGFDAYHTGLGGGIWIDVLKQAVINATYSVGEESLVNVGFDFLF
ncbi:metallophosphoesterase [Hymenobacter sp. 15J16-1T3B]|uniref:metallophosphoesterase n=1 Tax=Hymenobacter sp. 15J16-1T3B TaxID=2886941 RepID=UPI001D12943E|nr:metallophosphoesterase [Hymenobacter sp. 15J16-1T3B]MCC3156710.1 metallophosphoesterase [Hymenobacter sp. 15J16-1T3B]